MEKLHPKAIWLFFFHYLYSLIVVLIPLAFMGLPLLVEVFSEGEFSPATAIWVSGMVIALVAIYLMLCYLLAYLTYRFWRYELEAHSLKIEKGIIWKKYISIPYDRVQNVDIYRGLVDRILGLSDLHVQTAGYSGSFSGHRKRGISSEGRLPGLAPEIAEQLRDTLVKRTKGARQGL